MTTIWPPRRPRFLRNGSGGVLGRPQVSQPDQKSRTQWSTQRGPLHHSWRTEQNEDRLFDDWNKGDNHESSLSKEDMTILCRRIRTYIPNMQDSQRPEGMDLIFWKLAEALASDTITVWVRKGIHERSGKTQARFPYSHRFRCLSCLCGTGCCAAITRGNAVRPCELQGQDFLQISTDRSELQDPTCLSALACNLHTFWTLRGLSAALEEPVCRPATASRCC